MRPTSWVSSVSSESRGLLGPGKVIAFVPVPTRAYACLGQGVSAGGAGNKVTRGGQVGLAYSEGMG